MRELSVLQAVRLKGRVTSAALATTLAEDDRAVTDSVDDLAEAGLLTAGTTIRLTPAGRDRLDRLLREERDSLDQAAVIAAYDDFRPVNATFKAVMTDWQLRDGRPNPHDDAAYDAGVIARLHDVHSAVGPILGAVGEALPRLLCYRTKLAVALERIDDGDTTWLARPIVDSYHTVWFELHEELILAAGLTRHGDEESG